MHVVVVIRIVGIASGIGVGMNVIAIRRTRISSVRGVGIVIAIGTLITASVVIRAIVIVMLLVLRGMHCVCLTHATHSISLLSGIAVVCVASGSVRFMRSLAVVRINMCLVIVIVTVTVIISTPTKICME